MKPTTCSTSNLLLLTRLVSRQKDARAPCLIRCFATNLKKQESINKASTSPTTTQVSFQAADRALKTLLRTFDSEIKLQQKLMNESVQLATQQDKSVSTNNASSSADMFENEDAEEEIPYEEETQPILDTKLIIQAFEGRLKQAGWTIKDAPGMATVELVKIIDGNKSTLTVRFDVQSVIEGAGPVDESRIQNEEDEFEEDEENQGIEDEQKENEEHEEMDEEENLASNSVPRHFTFDVQLDTPALANQGRSMVMQCIAEYDGPLSPIEPVNTEEESSGVALSVDNIFIINKSTSNPMQTSTPYEGPDYQSLDSSLRQSIDDYVNERLDIDLIVPFISSYSHAKESEEYLKWLQTVRLAFSNQ